MPHVCTHARPLPRAQQVELTQIRAIKAQQRAKATEIGLKIKIPFERRRSEEAETLRRHEMESKYTRDKPLHSRANELGRREARAERRTGSKEEGSSLYRYSRGESSVGKINPSNEKLQLFKGPVRRINTKLI